MICFIGGGIARETLKLRTTTMRRSKAPSAFPSNASNPVNEILQSTENHVQVLADRAFGKPEQPKFVSDPTKSQHYSVIFGKLSTKKHKTFSEDGTLEINDRGTIIVKSSKGKYITSDSSGNQISRVEEGFVLTIGGFDVQIGEKIDRAKQIGHTTGIQRRSNAFTSPCVVVEAGNSKAACSPKAEKIVYTVVYGPITTKKHKTFDEDGTLEIIGKVARLKDSRGKTVGTDYNLKPSEILEGDRLMIEGKELEIIYIQTESVHGTKRDNIDEAQHHVKKPRLSKPRFVPPVREESEIESYENHEEVQNYEGHNIDPPADDQEQLFSNNIDYPSVMNFDEVDEEMPITSYKPVHYKEFLDSGSDTETSIKTVAPKPIQPVGAYMLPNPPLEHQFIHNMGPSTINPISIPDFLNQQLRDHQRHGVKFLYECVMGFHTVNGIQIQGAILADEMGLGKTIQTITLLYILLKQNPYNSRQGFAKRILIVTPSSLVGNWKNEIIKWLEHQRIYSFEVSQKNKPSQFANSLHIPIMIISYEMLLKQYDEINQIKFDVMVCDEGHRLKNNSTKIGQMLDQISCSRRILLTGTPIQNDLQEFFALINFVNPGILGTYHDFKARYENPIVQSQQSMVLPQFKELGFERANELSEITGYFFLRRTQEVLKKFLPKKQEIVAICLPSQLQQRLYSFVLNYYNNQKENLEKTISPLQLITILKKICNQPILLSMVKDPSMDFLKKQLPSLQRQDRFDSAKLEVVHFLLSDLVDTGERIVLISNYNKTLDILMSLCNDYNYKYVRLDGSTPQSDREKIVRAFNDPQSDLFVFLLSAKAGGTGLNLIGASRLVLFDNDWNPATDLQALSRIWRDGQTRNVYIYRLLTSGTIEEKIFQRQMSKTSLGGRVMNHSEKTGKLKFSDDELRDLFSAPDNYNVCNTHEMLRCNCEAIGEVPGLNSSQEAQPNINSESDSDEESIFRIRKKKQMQPKKTLQVHELMHWEHHDNPIQTKLLEELRLSSCMDLISFMFRNVTEHKSQE